MANGTVYDLQPGHRYQIRQDFKDYYNNEFKSGTILTFQKRDFLPYHGGYTITFAEQTLYFQEDASGDLLDNLWNYLDSLPKD